MSTEQATVQELSKALKEQIDRFAGELFPHESMCEFTALVCYCGAAERRAKAQAFGERIAALAIREQRRLVELPKCQSCGFPLYSPAGRACGTPDNHAIDART